MKHRCYIIDDDRTACLRIKEIIQMFPELEYLGYNQSPHEGIEKVLQLEPEIVFIDIEMPGMDGFEVVNRTRSAGIKPCFIFISAYDHYAIKAVKERAFDYLLKPVDISEFRETIDRIFERHQNDPLASTPLTDREKEVARLICQGKTSSEIASELFISKYTVDTHRKTILKKLGLISSNEMIARYSVK
ncbi:MAG: response regulator transcription factor [Bacteroidales bacterium]|nr:response regulator transcription factor [Bacteroidales bacterium]